MSIPEVPGDPAPQSARDRLRQWIKTLHRDPSAEELAMQQQRRQRLLDELTRAVAEAPEEVPIRDIIERLNRHAGD